MTCDEPHLRFVLAAGLAVPAAAQQDDPVKAIVERLDLERYKATIKGLTAFGDRREGTDRNRAAVDWIEAQLKSYGCPTERLRYEFQPRPAAAAPARGATTSNEPRPASGGGRYRGVRNPTSVNTDPSRQPNEKLRALNTQPSSGAGPREQVLHKDRHHAAGRDTSSARTWTPRLGRGANDNGPAPPS
jgi:hypothetical protein